MLALQAIAVLNYSTEPVATNPIFPSSPLSIAGVTFPEDRLYFAGFVVLISVALGSSTVSPDSAWPPGPGPRTTGAPR